jgi:uncharacterized protein YjdB
MLQKINKRIISSFLIVMLLSSFLPMKAYAGVLPDGLQDFLGYDYTTSPGTANSPDGYFIVTASKSGLMADEFGAFISDTASDTEEQVYIELRANGTLQSFELESLYVGEFYNLDVTMNGFRDVTVKGYAEGTEVFATFPYSSPDQGAAYEPNYPIDYSVADGRRIDSFRIYYTREIGTNDGAFNLVNFTIAESSETPPPVPTDNSVTVSPSTATVMQGGTTQLIGTANVSGGAFDQLIWISGDPSGKVMVDPVGMVFVAPDAVPGNYTITATSIFDPTKSDTVTISVITPPLVPTVNSVTVSPSTASVMQGESLQMTATVDVSGGALGTIEWDSTDISGKVSVDATGLVNVAADAAPGGYLISAFSLEDPLKFDSALITVTRPPSTSEIISVTVNPASATVNPGGNTQLTATVVKSGEAIGYLIWTTSDVNHKVTVDTTGKVRVAADATPGDYIITATAIEDFSKFGTATIHVVDLPVIPVAPNVSANDTTNKISGADITMEYSIDNGATWFSYDISNEPTFGGDKTVLVRIKAAGSNPPGITKTLIFTTNPSNNNDGETPSNPVENIPDNTPTRQVNVNAGDNSIAKIDIVRETKDDIKVDTIQLDSEKAEEIVKDAVDKKQDNIQIVIDDLESDPSDEVLVEINKDSLQQISNAKISLEIKTEDATVSLSGDTVQSLAAEGEDLYFRLIPIRNEEERATAIENAMSAQIVVNTAGGSEVQVLGTPMVIETNYKDLDTKVVFSLRNITQPTGEKELEEFVNSLAVFIEHSDGEKELQRGKILYDEDGKPVGIEISITKFSTFSIVGIKNAPPEASNLKISGSTLVGSKLKATFDYYDFDNDEKGKTIYQWYRAENAKGKNKQLIKGANASTYTITKEDMGKYIYLVVTPVAKTGELKGEQVAVAASQMVKEKIQYHAHVKLGVVGSKAYAEELAGIFKNTYKAGNVKVVKEGNYYRVYADFTSKASAEKACKELKDKKYIINYYIE